MTTTRVKAAPREPKNGSLTALYQHEKVLAHFQKFPDGRFSPSYIRDVLIRRGQLIESTPLTSIRRAISTATSQKRLTMLRDTVTGPYGHAEHLWTLNKKLPQTKYVLK